MSIDMMVACRTRPSFPEDLPNSDRWERYEHGHIWFAWEADSWQVLAGIDDMTSAHEMLMDAFGQGDDLEGACVVSVTIEPITDNPEALAVADAVVAMLEVRCSGVVID